MFHVLDVDTGDTALFCIRFVVLGQMLWSEYLNTLWNTSLFAVFK